jgi:para-aminobenzoate synthetase component 1
MRKFIAQANEYGRKKIPFFFLVDFEMKKPYICKLSDMKGENIYWHIDSGFSFYKQNGKKNMRIRPVSMQKYQQAYQNVLQNINLGNTYLLNLTFSSELQIRLSLQEIYQQSQARYRLLFKDQFTLFSPECFVKTKDNYIYSYPMKGTIDAALPRAKQQILNNKKELWEHNTIVDLIRNDLSIVAKNIEIIRYRFISEIHTNQKDLLQVSSEIRGELSENWHGRIGNILADLLPAGSISGAPKQKTLEIISEVEADERGYFTGVFGIFDGKNLDSAVNIRFIEKKDDSLIFRSGGGITSHSKMHEEYQELIDKIYVPFI